MSFSCVSVSLSVKNSPAFSFNGFTASLLGHSGKAHS